MFSRFNLLLLGVVMAGLALGAFLASITGTQSSQAAARPRTAQGAGPALVESGPAGPNAAPADGQDQGQGSADARARPLAGSVASVAGDTLTVATGQGEAKVKLAGARIQKTMDGAAEDLKAGTRVVLAGQQGADGVYAANSVQILPPGDAQGQGMAMIGRGPGQGQSQGQSQTQTQGPRQGSGQAQGQGQPRGQGQAPSAEGRSGPLTGSVTSLQGDTLTLGTPQGDARAKISGAKIQKTVEATIQDLQPGQRVAVVGQQGQDGVYTATSIQIVPEGESQAQPGREPASRTR